MQDQGAGRTVWGVGGCRRGGSSSDDTCWIWSPPAAVSLPWCRSKEQEQEAYVKLTPESLPICSPVILDIAYAFSAWLYQLEGRIGWAVKILKSYNSRNKGNSLGINIYQSYGLWVLILLILWEKLTLTEIEDGLKLLVTWTNGRAKEIKAIYGQTGPLRPLNLMGRIIRMSISLLRCWWHGE